MTLTEEDLIQLFYYKFTETPLLKRMDAVKDYFIDSWETLKGRNISEDDRDASDEVRQDVHNERYLHHL